MWEMYQKKKESVSSDEERQSQRPMNCCISSKSCKNSSGETRSSQSNESKLLSHFFRNEIFSQFSVKLIKVVYHSIVYEVSYGYYRTQITIFVSDLNLSDIQRQELGEGRHGQALKFHSQFGSRVAKKIRRSDQELSISNRLLKEIFFLKFMSSLEIGPKFSSLYSYDMIVHHQGYEFLMEYCPSDIADIYQHGINKFEADLKQNIEILHSFNGVHCDIKPANIGWSQNLKRFVFLDFDLSMFIQECPGEKRLTRFRGTYVYCSKEMQKAFKLNSGMVDFYENDQEGLNLSISFFKKRMIRLQKVQKGNRMSIDSLSQWDKILSFFQLQYHLFTCNFIEIQKLVRNQKYLILTFLRIVKNSYKGQTKSYLLQILANKYLQMYGQKTVEQVLDLSNIDGLLYQQLITHDQNQQTPYEPSFKNIKLLYTQEQFKCIWLRPRWMEKLFSYIYLIEHENQQDSKFITTLLNEINQKGLEAMDQKQLFLGGLEHFSNYFLSSSNFDYLFEIKRIYEIMFEINKMKTIEEVILNKVMEVGDKLGYLIYLKEIISELVNWPKFKSVTIPKKIEVDPQAPKIKHIFSQIMNLIYSLLDDISYNRYFSCNILELKIKEIYEQTPQYTQIHHEIDLLFAVSCFKCKTNRQVKHLNHQSDSQILQDLSYLRSLCYPQSADQYLTESIKEFVNRHRILSRFQTLWDINALFLQKKTSEIINLISKYFTQSKEDILYYEYFLPFLPVVNLLKKQSTISLIKFPQTFGQIKFQVDTSDYFYVDRINLVLDRYFTYLRYFSFYQDQTLLKQKMCLIQSIPHLLKIEQRHSLAVFIQYLEIFVRIPKLDGNIVQLQKQFLNSFQDCFASEHQLPYSCLKTIMRSIQVIFSYFTPLTQHYLESFLCNTLKGFKSKNLTSLVFEFGFVIDFILKHLFRQQQLYRVQDFIVNLGKNFREGPNFFFKIKGIDTAIRPITQDAILYYIQKNLQFINIQTTKNNPLLLYIIYKFFLKAYEVLSPKTSYRLILILIMGVKNQMKYLGLVNNEIASVFLRWIRKNRSLPKKKMINNLQLESKKIQRPKNLAAKVRKMKLQRLTLNFHMKSENRRATITKILKKKLVKKQEVLT